jgi:integrase
MARRSKGPWRRFKTTGPWMTKVNGKQVKIAEADESYDVALKRWHELQASSTRTVDQIPTTVAQVLDEYLEWVHHNRSTQTYKWYRGYLQSLHQYIGSQKLIANLRPLDVERWVQHEGYKSSNNRRGAVRSVKRAMNWAVQMGIIAHSPVARMPMPSYQRREGYVSQRRFDEILTQIDDVSLRTYLEFIWHTGCRPQEARLISGQHYDGKRIVLPIVDSKGKRQNRVLYLNSKAKAIVERLAKDHPKGPLFRNSRGNAWVANAVARRVRKYGITLTLLRHSWVTNALMNGVDTTTVAVLAGHKNTTMVQMNYQHLAVDTDYLTQAAIRATGGEIPMS